MMVPERLHVAPLSGPVIGALWGDLRVRPSCLDAPCRAADGVHAAPRRGIRRDVGRDRGLTFGEAAELYDRARPGYPEPLFDEVLTSVPGAARVLEAGAGTGHATAALAARGVAVEAVEPDPRMAAVALAVWWNRPRAAAGDTRRAVRRVYAAEAPELVDATSLLDVHPGVDVPPPLPG